MMWRLPSRFPVRPRAPRISAQTVGLTGGPCSHVGPQGLLATVHSVRGPRWVGAPRGGRTPEGGPAPFDLGRAGRREQAEVGPKPVVALRSLEAASLRLPGGPGGRLGESNGARGVLSPAGSGRPQPRAPRPFSLGGRETAPYEERVHAEALGAPVGRLG